MKILKYVALFFCFTTFNAFSETIDLGGLGGQIGGWDIPTSGTGKACNRVTFINRNSGKLQAGITWSKLKLISGTSREIVGSSVDKIPVKVNYSISPVQYLTGVYTLCLTPNGFSWSNLPTASYNFTFLVNGVDAADHGVFNISISYF